MHDEMTVKERWLAAVNSEPVDRLPFWPKLHTLYLYFRKAPFKNMTLNEMHVYLGSDKHIGLPEIVKETRSNVDFEEKTSPYEISRSYVTRFGELRSVSEFSQESQAWHPTVYPVKNKHDIKVLTEYYKNCGAELDKDSLALAMEKHSEIGEDASTAAYIGQSPLMHFIKYLAGVENAHYFLFDYKEEVEELFDAMHRLLLRKAAIFTEKNPADLLYMVEDISTKLISPIQFQEYCYKHIYDYGSILKEKNRNLVLHMGGHIKSLLPYLDRLPFKAFEAFTSPTVGDTRLADGREICEDKCFIGGTNAVMWMKSPGEIIHEMEEDLDALPHHRGLVITSGGNMPPMCEPETIKQVADWLKGYKIKDGYRSTL